MLNLSIFYGLMVIGPGGSLSDNFHLIALFRLLADHPRALAFLISRFGSAADVLRDATREDVAEAGLRRSFAPRLGRQLEKEVHKDLGWLEASDHHLLVLGDENYPPLLQEIYDPPYLLFAAGDPALLSAGICVAMVGSRGASQYGIRQTEAIASDLAQTGLLIVSGLALGIDGAAHRGALKSGGKTVAVLGTGCDEIYPRRHRKLAEQITMNGILLSEFPLGTGAFPSSFPRRNRIVTGMSRATIVVEAALKSGSLISARLAASEGREVMAVPGQVTNRLAQGCHKLIKEGAKLIETSGDVLEELGYERLPALTRQLDELQRAVIHALAGGPKSPDLLVAEIDAGVDDLLATLVGLEVLGLIHSETGKYALCTPPD